MKTPKEKVEFQTTLRDARRFSYVVLVLALLVAGGFMKCQWDECREQELSRFYCVKHVL